MLTKGVRAVPLTAREDAPCCVSEGRVVCPTTRLSRPSCLARHGTLYPSAKQGQLPLLGIEAQQRCDNGFHTLQLMVRILMGELPALHPRGIALPSQCQLSAGFVNLLGKGDHGLGFSCRVGVASKGHSWSLWAFR